MSIWLAARLSMFGNRRPSKSRTIWKVNVDNTASPIEPDRSVGKQSRSLTTRFGRSGDGVRRPGFERLLAAICEGRIGAVMSVEASRLARNGRDWHTLLEFCGLVGTIIGMKGTMSELELSVFRQRSVEAMKQKARRGELFLTVAVGYVKAGRDWVEKDPDRRVQEAIALVFRRFAELQSIRQVLVWFRQEKIPLPVLTVGDAAERIVWKAPVYSTVHHILTNPVYAGAYAFGRLNDARRHRERAKARSAEHAARLESLEHFNPGSP